MTHIVPRTFSGERESSLDRRLSRCRTFTLPRKKKKKNTRSQVITTVKGLETDIIKKLKLNKIRLLKCLSLRPRSFWVQTHTRLCRQIGDKIDSQISWRGRVFLSLFFSFRGVILISSCRQVSRFIVMLSFCFLRGVICLFVSSCSLFRRRRYFKSILP